jgi:hypothetical protein
MPRLPTWCIVFTAFIFPVSVSALTINFSSPPDPITVGVDVPLQVTLTCSGCNFSYLRGAFAPSATSSAYFGLTENRLGEWIGTSTDKTKYFSVLASDLVGSTWSGQIKFKVTDLPASQAGQYYFKIGRYTSASSSATWSDPVPVNLVYSTPTPTVESTPIPTIEPTSTPEPSPIPTLEPSPTSIPTIEPTIIPTPSKGQEQRTCNEHHNIFDYKPKIKQFFKHFSWHFWPSWH